MQWVYQLDKHRRRLLWCGKDRKIKTLLRFFREFGKERCPLLRFVCSDMWSAYFKVIKKKSANALNILDRFHIMKKFNEAIDEVRRQEIKKAGGTRKGKCDPMVVGYWGSGRKASFFP